MTKQERVLIRFHNWMLEEGWELHSSHEYYYKLEHRSQWPPLKANMCSEEELIEKFKTYCMENMS